MNRPIGRQPSTSEMPWLPYARQSIVAADIEAVVAVLRSESVTQGPAIASFEAALTAVTGARHAVAVSSGTSALHLSCLGLDMGPGKVGVTTPITFVASANCFRYVGADPAFADVDAGTGLITPDTLGQTLKKLRDQRASPGVVVAVSLAGRAPDLPKLAEVCAEFGWALVEDAAHALGGEYATNETTHRCGSCTHTRAAILSFHPVKHICTGEGGAILTNDDELALRLRRLRTHGIEKNQALAEEHGAWYYEQTELGYHYRLTDIQAALGVSQLQRLPEFLARRRALARRYAEQLSGSPCLRVLQAPVFDKRNAYHLFTVHFHSAALRRAGYEHLARSGIGSQVHYIPVYRHPDFRRVVGDLKLPGAEKYYEGCLSLPLFPDMTDDDQDRVIDALRSFASEQA